MCSYDLIVGGPQVTAAATFFVNIAAAAPSKLGGRRGGEVVDYFRSYFTVSTHYSQTHQIVASSLHYHHHYYYYHHSANPPTQSAKPQSIPQHYPPTQPDLPVNPCTFDVLRFFARCAEAVDTAESNISLSTTCMACRREESSFPCCLSEGEKGFLLFPSTLV